MMTIVNNLVIYHIAVFREDPNCSHHKEKNSFLGYLYEMIDVN